MANFDMGRSHDAVQSDTPNDHFNWILVTTAGAVAILDVGGDTNVLADVPAATWIPVGDAVAVKSTGTTATGIMVV